MVKRMTFICYNKTQRNYFRDNGCRDVVYGKHTKTEKLFWVFERTEKFNELLDKWCAK